MCVTTSPPRLPRAVGIIAIICAAALFPTQSSLAASLEDSPALVCGPGKWYDDQESDPECVTCAKKKWCPPRRDQDSSCRYGHTGQACSKCLDNFYFNQRDRCTECPSRGTIFLAWAGTAVGCIIAGVGIYHYAEADLTALTIAVTHFQLTFVYFSFNFEYPKMVKMLAATLRVFMGFGFVLDVVGGWASPTCLGLSGLPFSVWWALQMLAPFLFMAPYVAIFMLTKSRQREDRLSDAAKAPDDRLLSVSEYEARKAARLRSKRAAQAILLICISSLMNGVYASFHVWFCKEFSDGSLRIAADPSVVCSWDNPDYRSLMVVSGLFFVLYFFGTSGMLMYIIDCEDGRRASAAHCVTHAR